MCVWLSDLHFLPKESVNSKIGYLLSSSVSSRCEQYKSCVVRLVISDEVVFKKPVLGSVDITEGVTIRNSWLIRIC